MQLLLMIVDMNMQLLLLNVDMDMELLFAVQLIGTNLS